MAIRNVVFLQTPGLVIPLLWSEWTVSWNGLSSARAVCSMLMPEDDTQRHRLMELFMRATPMPCWLYDATQRGWYRFQTFITEVALPTAEVVRVRLLPDGPVTLRRIAATQRLEGRQRRRARRQARLVGKE